MTERIRNLCLISATLAVFFLAAELVTRALVPAPLPWFWPQTVYETSPTLGFRLKPRQTAYTADKEVRTNSKGLRGPERSWDKPPGVRRVLVLGDSVAFGYGVRYEDSFPARLETRLNGQPAARYEVINAAVPSFNAVQEVTYLREEGLRFQPDLVVLALYWNDISDKSGVTVDNAGRLVESRGGDPGQAARFRESARGAQIRNWLKQSRFLYFVIDRLRTLRAGAGENAAAPVQMQHAVLSGTPDPRVELGWLAVRERMAEAARLSAEAGSHLLVALMPMPQTLGADYPRAQYPRIPLAYCRDTNLDCVDMTPVFKKHFTSHTSLFIPYDGDHPNERGHDLIAQALSEPVRRLAARGGGPAVENASYVR